MAVLQFPTPTVFRNLDTPTAPSDAVTKAYVDSIATQNAVWTNANDTITFSNVDGSTFDVKLTGFADLDNATLTGNTTITTLILSNVLGTEYGGTGLTSFTENGVMFGANTSSLSFTTGTDGQVLQISANGTPSFDVLDGGTFS
jgi:hypothetical protein